jgi:hypothetical protein
MLPLIQSSDLQILPFSLNKDESVNNNNHHVEDAEIILADI